jgi:hypothetical protein
LVSVATVIPNYLSVYHINMRIGAWQLATFSVSLPLRRISARGGMVVASFPSLYTIFIGAAQVDTTAAGSKWAKVET